MKKTTLVFLASLFSLNAFANSSAPSQVVPTAPWDRVECRAVDVWGRVFTATGHDWHASRGTELQNEALDMCSQASGLYNCRPMGCWYY